MKTNTATKLQTKPYTLITYPFGDSGKHTDVLEYQVHTIDEVIEILQTIDTGWWDAYEESDGDAGYKDEGDMWSQARETAHYFGIERGLRNLKCMDVRNFFHIKELPMVRYMNEEGGIVVSYDHDELADYMCDQADLIWNFTQTAFPNVEMEMERVDGGYDITIINNDITGHRMEWFLTTTWVVQPNVECYIQGNEVIINGDTIQLVSRFL
jgi:hypothetical protein